MHKIIKNLCIRLCLLLIVLSGCVTTAKTDKEHTAGGKAPLWISEPSSVYPEALYLSGVGYGHSRRDAEDAAVAVLTKTVSQKVEAQSSSVQLMDAEVSAAQNVRRGFSSVIRTSSTVDEISGLAIKETWADKNGTVYALAVINREDVGSHYEAKIKAAEDGINGFILFAADNPASFEALSALKKAAASASENEKNLSLLSVIHPGKYKNLSLAYKNTQTVEALLYREIEKTGIAVEVENDKNKRIETAFLKALKDAGFKTASGTSSAADLSSDVFPYILKASITVEPFKGKTAADNIYVRYTVHANLTDRRTGKIVLPWSISGREAHITQSEAENRALRTVENEIKEKFLAHF